MTYQHNLPKVFPYLTTLTWDECRELVGLLLQLSSRDYDYDGRRYEYEPPKGIPNGSSFAITCDAPQGYWHLWLSKCSLELLTKNRLPNTGIQANIIEVDRSGSLLGE